MRAIHIITMILIIPLLISSCGEKKNRKVYFGFEVGGSKKMAEINYEEYRKQNKRTELYGYPYYEHQFDGGNHYYSSPLFQFVPNDTIIHSLNVYYTLDPKELDNVIETTKRELISMQPFDTTSIIIPKMVFEDISKEINNQYGQFDNIDTIYGTKNQIVKKWNNKNGMNITLSYTYNQMMFFELTNYYSLILRYTLTDENKTTLIKNKSIY